MTKPSWYLDAKSYKLYGGFVCEITADEHNEWHELLVTKGLRSRINELERDQVIVSVKAVAQVITDDQISEASMELWERLAQLHDECYALGKEWYAGVQRRRDEAMDKEVSTCDEIIRQAQVIEDKGTST